MNFPRLGSNEVAGARQTDGSAAIPCISCRLNTVMLAKRECHVRSECASRQVSELGSPSGR